MGSRCKGSPAGALGTQGQGKQETKKEGKKKARASCRSDTSSPRNQACFYGASKLKCYGQGEHPSYEIKSKTRDSIKRIWPSLGPNLRSTIAVPMTGRISNKELSQRDETQLHKVIIRAVAGRGPTLYRLSCSASLRAGEAICQALHTTSSIAMAQAQRPRSGAGGFDDESRGLRCKLATRLHTVLVAVTICHSEQSSGSRWRWPRPPAPLKGTERGWMSVSCAVTSATFPRKHHI